MLLTSKLGNCKAIKDRKLGNCVANIILANQETGELGNCIANRKLRKCVANKEMKMGIS